MATLGANTYSLIDITQAMDPDGKVAAVAEILAEKNEILGDIPFLEGNMTLGHKSTRRTSQPSGTFRRFNKGVAAEKSTRESITDGVGMLETYLEIDKAEANINNNSAEFFASEQKAVLEGLSQTMADTVFYGDVDTNVERFNGLVPRYSALTGADTSNYIVNAGEADTLTSIWLIGWGTETVHGIYPKGSQAGLQIGAMKEERLEDADGNKYEGLYQHFKWDAGIVVKDPRYCVRIANIDTSDLLADPDGAGSSHLINLMIQALETIHSRSGVNLAFYMNRYVRMFLRLQISNKSNVWLSMNEVAGKEVLAFDGVPVNICDAITKAETAVA